MSLTTAEVCATIRDAGQTPHLGLCQTGNERLSCVFCIMAQPQRLWPMVAATAPSYTLNTYELEQETGWTMFPDASLAERSAS